MSTQTVTIDQKESFFTVSNVALWVIQLGAAYLFVNAGAHKLGGDEQMVGLFNVIGIGQWFRFVTGGLEVLGAILLVIPAFVGLGGLVLTGVMFGAVATHLFIIGGNPTFAIVLLVASIVIAYARRDRTIDLLRKF